MFFDNSKTIVLASIMSALRPPFWIGALQKYFSQTLQSGYLAHIVFLAKRRVSLSACRLKPYTECPYFKVIRSIRDSNKCENFTLYLS